MTDNFGVSYGLYSCLDDDQARQPMRRCIRTYVLGYSERDVDRARGTHVQLKACKLN